MLNTDAPRAACADRLDLVDATFDRRRGNGSLVRQRRAIATLRAVCCQGCPLRRECRLIGQGEHYGAWG